MRRQKVLIIGLGLHGGGVGTANYFLRRGDDVTITDLKTRHELKESIDKLVRRDSVRFVLGRHVLKDFERADLIVKNPAVPPDSPYLEHAARRGIPIDTDIGIFIDRIKDLTRNVIGVTGTKGKSTTTALIHRILLRRYPDAVCAGNITVSVLDVLESVRQGAYVVLELSSFQLGGIALKGYSPRVAVFTNFMEDHLNYYKDMEAYFKDKEVLYKYQKAGDFLVWNRDDAALNRIKASEGVRTVSFGMDGDFKGAGSFIKDGMIWLRGLTRESSEEPVLRTDAVRLPGEHNLHNLLAASAVAFLEGIPPQDIEEAVRSFRGLEHRLEYIGEKDSVSFYNDSAATTPDAAAAAIGSFGRPVALIAGGFDKGLSLKRFARAINRGVSMLVLLKGSGTESLLREKLDVPYMVFDDLQDAVRHAAENAGRPGVVLLSPGFASFGMFRHEFHRGDEFRRCVKEIIGAG